MDTSPPGTCKMLLSPTVQWACSGCQAFFLFCYRGQNFRILAFVRQPPLEF